MTALKTQGFQLIQTFLFFYFLKGPDSIQSNLCLLTTEVNEVTMHIFYTNTRHTA